MRFPRALLSFGMFLATLSGCATINKDTSRTTEITGLFKSAEEAIRKAEKLESGVTSCPAGLKALGFDPDGKNVRRLPGALGSQYYLGTTNPQVVISKTEDITDMPDAFSRYFTLVYPLRDLQNIKDRLYINKRDEVTTGPEGEYYIVCRDGVVYKHNFTGWKNVHRPKTQKKFGGNLLEEGIKALPRMIP